MINAYMNDDITLKVASLDTWGRATYTEVAIKGRFEYRTKMIRNIKGQQVVSMAKVYLASRALDHADKIVYGGKEYSILNIEQVKDFSNKFIKVDLA
jgi:hypothetical protein